MERRPPGDARETIVGVVGWAQETNEALVSAWRQLGLRAELLTPNDALRDLGDGDVAVGRFDVLQTLDGPEPGIEVLPELERRGVRVLNGVEALLNAHDKLLTAGLLERAGLPHPKTEHLANPTRSVEIAPPFVVKPRYGSWGIDVFRCATGADLERTLVEIEDRPWFARHGALVQELVPPAGFDLRLVVAGGEVVGAAERVARAGEWRTNVSLGGTKHPTGPSAEACALGVQAARAIGADLVGVDLLPAVDGWVVLELNGAVEFDRVYDLSGSSKNVYDAAASALGLPRSRRLSSDRSELRSTAPR
ncbi:MAG TPA: RimK family alpha-L-glutamate ligase [Gaiellaceae bacterium]